MNQHQKGRKTLVTVHGYAGDAHQITGNLPSIEHHELPIVIFSPLDSPINKMGPHICRHGGKRAYTGQDSLDRQLIHMRMMLEYDFDFYLAHDSDSLLLSKEIPEYVYSHPYEVFSNQVIDPRINWPQFGPNFHKPLPAIAMQPPYFYSRDSLEKMVAVGPGIKMCPTCPFIDWYMVQLVYAAKLKHSRFMNCVSCGTSHPEGLDTALKAIAQGANFVHTSKSPAVRKAMQRTWDKRK
jgi:hypothetical protein